MTFNPTGSAVINDDERAYYSPDDEPEQPSRPSLPGFTLTGDILRWDHDAVSVMIDTAGTFPCWSADGPECCDFLGAFTIEDAAEAAFDSILRGLDEMRAKVVAAREAVRA